MLTWGVDLHTDHVDHDPLNNDPRNLVPSCQPCNNRRSRQRYASQLTHCKNGHRLDAANVYVNPASGSRQCRICSTKHKTAWRAKAKAARRAAKDAVGLPDIDERRAIRVRAALTQNDLAVMAGVSVQAVLKWENGYPISASYAVRYKQALDRLAAMEPSVRRCKRGHEQTEANLYRRSAGGTMCRPCQRMRELAHRRPDLDAA
jgi:DNA-binding transcriptional regulator YiaG